MQRGKKIINGSLVTLVKFKGHEHAGDDENLWLFTEEWEMKMGKNNVVDGWLCGEQDEKSKLFEHLYFCIITWNMCRETKNTSLLHQKTMIIKDDLLRCG